MPGIYPREPVNKKKANKGSSAPASFYYSKDILYLLHEPLLAKFREHKTFAKKLARALGRGEWALAKGLEERKPVARLDHLVKERYPTFGLALKDLNDPLSLLSLFMGLPTNPVPGRTTVPPEVIAETGRLVSEWKVGLMGKVFGPGHEAKLSLRASASLPPRSGPSAPTPSARCSSRSRVSTTNARSRLEVQPARWSMFDGSSLGSLLSR
jgi:hypothetical protein